MPDNDTSCTTVEKSLVEHYLGRDIPSELIEETLPTAKRKLDRIISREGDADGERLKPYYLAQLIAEAIRSIAFSIYCDLKSNDNKAINMEKECTTQSGTPLTATIL